MRALRTTVVVVVLVISLFSIHAFIKPSASPTGFVVQSKPLDADSEGCCMRFCQESKSVDCPFPGEFAVGKDCSALDACNVGCCMDEDFYCYTNYLKGNCVRNDFTFIRNMCNELWDCVAPHPEVPYTCYAGFGAIKSQFECRQADLPNAMLQVRPPSARANTVFSLTTRIMEDPELVTTVVAKLLDERDTVLGSVVLFDTGEYNDGGPNDGLFGNVWDSKNAPSGVNYLTVELSINREGKEPEVKRYENFFAVVGGTDCVPMGNYAGNDFEKSLDIAIVNKNFRADSPVTFQGAVTHAADALYSVVQQRELARGATFHRIDPPLAGTLSAIRAKTQSECSMIRSDDFILLLDPEEPECFEYGSSPTVIRVNPSFTFDTLEGVSANELFEDPGVFCQHIVTEQTLLREVIEENTPAQFSFLPARDEPLPEDYRIPYTVQDNRPGRISVGFMLNHQPLDSLNAEVDQGITNFVSLPCLRSNEVHILAGSVMDVDDNYNVNSVTIDVGPGQGFNEENCPPGTPRDVWYANMESVPATAAPTFGNPFDPARASACEASLDLDPFCCYGRGTWVPADESVMAHCDSVRCGEDFPACPLDRGCNEEGYCT